MVLRYFVADLEGRGMACKVDEMADDRSKIDWPLSDRREQCTERGNGVSLRLASASNVA